MELEIGQTHGTTKSYDSVREEQKVKIALETFGAARVNGDRIRDFFADPAEYLWQYNNMNTEYKTMCVDTGHTLDDIGYKGNYNFEIRTNCFGDYLEEYIRFVGKYVRNFVDKKGRV